MRFGRVLAILSEFVRLCNQSSVDRFRLRGENHGPDSWLLCAFEGCQLRLLHFSLPCAGPDPDQRAGQEEPHKIEILLRESNIRKVNKVHAEGTAATDAKVMHVL